MKITVVPVEKVYFIYCIQFYCMVLTSHPDLSLPEIIHLRFALFWDFTLCTMVVCDWRFGKNYASYLKGSGRPLTIKDGTDRLSWKVSNKLPFHPVKNPKRSQISHWDGSLNHTLTPTFKSTNPFSEILLPLFEASNFCNCDVFIFMLLLSGGYIYMSVKHGNFPRRCSSLK